MSSVAVLGASTDRSKFGNKALRAYQMRGFTLFPVHPREASIEGVAAWPNLSKIPVRPDAISAYLPPKILLTVLPEIAAKGCDELWLNPGTDTDEVLAEAKRLKLNVVQGCSVVRLGLSPEEL